MRRALGLSLLLLFGGTTSVFAKKKSVTAHLMFGEMQDYKVEDHVADQKLAKESGIDAFAINTGHDQYDQEKCRNVFAAAKETGFPLFFSFDLLHYNKPNASNWILYDYLLPYATLDEYYKIDNRVVVSTFSGAQDGSYIDDVGSFKEANEVWQHVIDTAKTFDPPIEIYFVPFWLKMSAIEDEDNQVLEGLSGVGNWLGFGTVGDKSNVTAERDLEWHDATTKRGVDYWAGISHSFSVHQMKTTNNYVHPGNNWLLATHYRDIIELGDKSPDHIELITWSDWGESTYFSPVRERANEPHQDIDTAVYSNTDHDHVPFLRLATYYNHWFKNGVAPKITQDTIVWWYRGQPAQAEPANNPIGQPAGADALTDTIWAVVLLPEDTKATNVVITSGGKEITSETVSPGVNLIRGEFNVGEQSIALQDDDGKMIIEGSGVDITDKPEWWDYNYFSYIVPADRVPSDFLDVDGSGGGGETYPTGSSTSTGSPSTSTGKSSTPSGYSTTSSGSGTSTSSASSYATSSTSNCPSHTPRWRKPHRGHPPRRHRQHHPE